MSTSASSGSSALSFIEKEVTNNKVVVFSKSTCPHSTHLKELLEGLPLKQKPVVHEVDRMAAGNEVMDRLGTMTGARTTPRVFIEGKCIGGDDATTALNATGELKMMLQEAGAL